MFRGSGRSGQDDGVGQGEAAVVEAERPFVPKTLSDSSEQQSGSTVLGASFNLCNSIVGAGCIGFGGAIAESGGLISVLVLLFVGYLTKLSFDLLIDLSVLAAKQHQDDEQPLSQEKASYETLGYKTFGKRGRMAVIICKGGYAFLVLVAYMIIIRDNFSSAMRHYFLHADEQGSWWAFLLGDRLSTFILCTTVMLPLCLLRDLKLLEGFSAVKIVTFFHIILTVIYLFWTTPQENTAASKEQTTWKEHWLQIRPGCIQNMGTFVCSFVAQHTIHIVFQSLQTNLQNPGEWRKVSTLSVLLSLTMSLPIGLFVYMTYWERTTSNLFEVYPTSTTVDTIQILLCVVMLLTYPPPFFSLRQLIVDTSVTLSEKSMHPPVTDDPTETESMLPKKFVSSGGSKEAPLSPYHHTLITILIWAATLTVALVIPTLGDVLNLAGCAFGTAIAFILPALFCYRLRGITVSAAVLFLVGGTIGVVGTFQTLIKLLRDLNN